MSVYQPAHIFEKAKIIAAPKRTSAVASEQGGDIHKQAMPDRHFDLPPVIHGALFTIIMAYLGIMAMATGEREMIIPFVIFAVFVIMFFAVPACWSLMQPEAETRQPQWSHFMRNGIQIETGHLSARDALIQIFTVPLIILGWGMSVAIIVS